MKGRVKYVLVLAAVLLSAAAGVASEYRFRYYTDADGLSSNTIQSLYQDSAGYVWVGTANGLDRFNSNDFTNFSSYCGYGRELENDCIYAICGERSAGRERIWIGTSDGVFVFDTLDSRFVRFRLADGEEEYCNVAVYALMTDASECMWIATLGAGIFRYDPRSGRTEHFDSRSHPKAFASDVVPSILLDNGNNVWVACGQTVSRYNPENGSFSSFRVEDTRQQCVISRVSRMCLDSFGNIWIAGYESEMFKFEVQQLAFTANRPVRNFGRIRGLIEHTPGVMLLGTDSGLVDFLVEKRAYRQTDDGTSGRNGRLTDKFVHALLKDRNGGIWVGTYFGGINYLSPYSTLFSSLEGGEGCGHVISKFCEDVDGRIWIGSDDGGLSLYDPRTGSYEYVAVDSAVAALNIHALMLDDGALWVGTYGSGLYRMDKAARSVRHYTAQDEHIENLDVYALLRDASQRMWIGTKAGICVYDDESDSIRCVYRSEYDIDIVDIAEDRDGRVWFATMGNGLMRYDYRSDRFERILIGSGDRRSDFVSCLAMSAANMWIGTQGNGLWRYDTVTGEVEHEFAGTKYADCTIFQIVQNGEELWLTTNHGLLQYDCGKRRMPVVFTSDDGLLANIFNFNSGFKSQSGHIYLGSNNGVNRFYPYDFVDLDTTAEPDVVFGDIEFLGCDDCSAEARPAIDCLRRVEIGGSRVSFGLDFIALNYSSPLRTVYRYRLSGIDRDWIFTGLNFRSGMQRAYYSDLPPGKYLFTVSASDDGEHFGRESSVEITVKAPWWMSNVMYVVYGIVLLAGVAVAGFRWRQRVVDERRRELAALADKDEADSMRARINLATDLENEICEPLSLISAMVSELSDRNGLPVALQEEAERIRRNCDVLAMRMNRMFDVLRSENVPADAESENDSAQQDSPPLPELPGPGVIPLRGKTISGQTDVLFVDSNEEYLDFAMRSLSHLFAVYGASGGREALDLLHAHRFSAVVCGTMSKDNMDGIALCKAIKTDERLEDISVILLTTNVSKQLKMQALLAGSDICLQKSVAMDYLALQIRTLVDTTNRRRLKYSRNPYLRSGADDSTLRTNNFMERLNAYISEHLSDADLMVDDIAAELGVSRTKLFMHIKELTGTTPNELLRSVRLNRAAELFAERSDLRVSEICYMVGFTSVSYFAKCFRKRFGMLPNQYIERCRSKER